jgi:hypothetical protein
MRVGVWLVLPSLVLGAARSSRAQEPAGTGSEVVNVQSRQEIAESLIAAAEARAGRRLDEAFRLGLRARLAGLPEGAWRELEGSRDLSSVKAPLGGSAASARLIYRTLPPCRIIDTRLAGGSLAPGSPRTFRVTGGDLSFQGGSAAGCDVPLGPAQGALINFVAVNPTGAGNLRAWSYDVVNPPSASILNYGLPGSGLNIANGIAVPICNADPNPGDCPQDIRVQADLSGIHLVADVVGYFEKLPPVAIFTATGGAGLSQLTASCANAAGNEITVIAPSAGKILVNAQGRLQFQNVNVQQVSTFVGSSANDCTHSEGSFHAEMPIGVTSNPYNIMAPTWAVFDVPAAGTYIYYLNGLKTQNQAGRNVAIFTEAKFSAVFIPN